MWAENWQNQSYWLDGLEPTEKSFETIVTNVDVLIIGSGYTGLHASIQIAGLVERFLLLTRRTRLRLQYQKWRANQH